ncbi:MAG: flagellar biosynthetic protein FliR [Vampirovibrio sp.]
MNASTLAVGSTLLQWLSMPHLLATFLVFCRVTGLFLVAPFFNHPALPLQLRLWFGLSIGVIFYLTLNGPQQMNALAWMPMDLAHLLPFILKELALGLLMGLVMKYMMDALHLAGESLSQQMGLSMASALDPSSGAQSPIISNLLSQYALILFMALGMHHWVLLSLHSSFELLPLSFLPDWTKMGLLSERMILVSAGMFSTGLMLAAPIQALLLMVEVALGYISKLMPQMNVFMVAAPLKIMLGLWGIITFLPAMQSFMTNHYQDHIKVLRFLFKGLGSPL